ncbi:MAG: type II toxin-antitoxin system Phd/YefM family antitoxin [Candidatus Abawacabacteria bacterium]|nr:type II toxin-antitoxin system Phd/YefM family antitoxin [Candidatus Abawacabacteria bacterium]
MYTTDGAVIVGTSELRSEGGKVFKALEGKRVIVTQKGKPIGVMESFESYEQKEKKLEVLEDIILAILAKERLKKKGKKISAEQMQALIFS